jgi:hypothetical protein
MGWLFQREWNRKPILCDLAVLGVSCPTERFDRATRSAQWHRLPIDVQRSDSAGCEHRGAAVWRHGNALSGAPAGFIVGKGGE